MGGTIGSDLIRGALQALLFVILYEINYEYCVFNYFYELNKYPYPFSKELIRGTILKDDSFYELD
jgi:hypothetical protein